MPFATTSQQQSHVMSHPSHLTRQARWVSRWMGEAGNETSRFVTARNLAGSLLAQLEDACAVARLDSADAL
jgi:hypothetical protein